MRLPRFTLLAALLITTATPYAQARQASIRSVDFKNFTYPLPAELRTPGAPAAVTLRRGRYAGTDNEDGMHFSSVTYGDVTGDGEEEAMIYLGIQTRGSAMPGVVYVYTLRGRRPRLLWSFPTGDRADGGLHRLYAEGGLLVVELYGPQKRWEGDGQPMRFTRRRYVWRGRRFSRQGRAEVLALPTSQRGPAAPQSWRSAIIGSTFVARRAGR